MITRAVAALAFATLVAACGPKPAPAPGGGGGGGDTTPTPTEVTLDTSKLGTSCGADGSCADGLSCARYYGIAGPSGPEFSSCEVACDTGQECPAGTACVTIADGPGAVCRVVETSDQPPVGE